MKRKVKKEVKKEVKYSTNIINLDDNDDDNDVSMISSFDISGPKIDDFNSESENESESRSEIYHNSEKDGEESLSYSEK